MKKMCNRRGMLLTLIILCIALMPITAHADVKYSTFSKDSDQNLIWLQPAYYPIGIIGDDLYVPDPSDPTVKMRSTLNNAKDIFIDVKDEVYIVDSGNNRIVHLDANGELVRYLSVTTEKEGDLALNGPEGIFVTPEGEIYIADTGNKRIVKMDKDGNVVQIITRPQSRYLSETYVFNPAKLVVDNRGYIFVAVQGSYEGLMLLDKTGGFQGFFGANKTVLSAMDAIKRMLYTKEMYANEQAKRPETITSVASDKNGFIYTVSGGAVQTNQLRKLNIKGNNQINTGRSFGEFRAQDTMRISGGYAVVPHLIDVAVDESGNMIVVDQNFKYISHYDTAGNLLYFWGGISPDGTSQVGLLKSPVAIDVNSRNELFVLDSQENIVQMFRLSEFGEKVDNANQLTLAGYYEQSEGPWNEVLRLNAQFTPAINGLAKSAYKKEQYEEAMTLFKESGDQTGFSDSFWQIRLFWLQKYFSWIATVGLVFGIGLALFEKYTKKSKFRSKWRGRKRSTNPFVLNLKHIFYTLKHPIDGFSAIRYEGRGSYGVALLIMLFVYFSLIFKQVFTSFSFSKGGFIDIYSTFTQFFVVWIAWVICNYLVSSIYRGEGRFKDIFIGSAYALVPYIVVGVPLAIISNVMTQNDVAIYDFLNNGLLIWVVLLMIWKIQNIHNYSVGETLMNVFLTACTMITLGVLIFVTAGLTNDFISLIVEIAQEVIMR